MKKLILSFVVVFAVVGCASTEANLQFESARSIGNVAPDNVEIDNIDRGMTTIKWDAKTITNSYKCSADDMVRRVLCVKN